EEGLVPSVVNFGNGYGTVYLKPVFVVPLPTAYRAVSIVAPTVGIQLVVLEVVIEAAMPLVAAGFSRGNQNTAGGAAILGREAVGNESDFANGLLRRSIRVVESRIIPGVLPIEE